MCESISPLYRMISWRAS